MVLTLADMDGQETFEASALGTAAEVCHVLQAASLSCQVDEQTLLVLCGTSASALL